MRTVLSILAVLVLLAPVGAQEDEEALRAEAHRTILRRLSAKADTAKLGLPEASTAFIDLFLDLERNREEIRSGVAPRSARFSGTPHVELKPAAEVLILHASFGRLKIDTVELPYLEMPDLAFVALDEEAFAAARIPDEDEKAFAVRRLSLLSAIALFGDEKLKLGKETGEAWGELRGRIASTFLASLDAVPPTALFPILGALTRLGDDATARALAAHLEKLPASAPPYVRPMLVRAICGLPGPTAEAHLESVLVGEDARLKVSALSAVRRESGEKVFRLVEAMLYPETGEPDLVRGAAIRALEKMGTDRAREVLEKRFADSENDERIVLGLALTRMGSDVALPALREALARLEKATDPRSRFLADRIRRNLEQRGAEKGADEER
jgi:hypothetical protein